MKTAVLAVAVLFSSTLRAAVEDYAALQKWQYGVDAISITKPVTITSDTATWTLNSGSVHVMQPTSSGRITGLVFEGEGRFTMTVPDPFELDQLRRFTDKPSLDKIDQPFTQLVVRTSDDRIGKLFPNAPKAFAANSIAEKRQNHWLIDLRTDIDARIVAASVNPGALQMTIAAKTADFDWLTYDYDSTRDEEIQLIRWPHNEPEVWLSLDRAQDRGPDGRPGARSSALAHLNFIDVNADLSRHGWNSVKVGETQQLMMNGHYSIEEEINPLADGLGALVMRLDPRAQNLIAHDEEGKPLVLLRDHIGARSMAVGNKIWNSDVTILFPAPLKAQEERHITFDYDLESENYALGNTWYPTVPGAFDDHTARLVLTVAKKSGLRAMGRLADQKDVGETIKSTWIVDKPTKMVTFATAEHFDEERVDVQGLPHIISFGWASGLDVRTRLRNSAADVANSMQYFQLLLGDPVGGENFYVTSITGYHGQAFDGFLHLAESSYSESPGASELFRAHEVAHEWFGHRVGWRSYRDQWLSESLAEYAAMMFVQSTMKDGPRYFNEILQAYEGMVKGSASFSKFSRPWLVERSAALRGRIGPIGHGYRSSTADVPAGYLIQTYVKGPLVLNMLRELLRAKSHSDDLFVTVLRDFVHEYSGKLATTADFERIVERDSQTNFRWFFDSWIYRAEIPNVRWSYRIEPSGTAYKMTLTVKKSDVPSDFVFVAPVRLQFDGGKTAMTFVMAKGNEETITRDIPMKPRDVLFAPDYSLLANIKRE